MTKPIMIFLSSISKKKKDLSKASLSEINDAANSIVTFNTEEEYLYDKPFLKDVISNSDIKQEVIIKSKSLSLTDIVENRTKLSLKPISNIINGVYKKYNNYES